MRLRAFAVASLATLALVAGTAATASSVQADTPASTVSLAKVPSSMLLPVWNHQGTGSFTVTVTNPVAGMSYRIDEGSITQPSYAKPIEVYSKEISTTGVIKAGFFEDFGAVGGTQKITLTVIGFIPNTETSVTLPTVTKKIKLVGRDTQAQEIEGSGFVKPGHSMTVVADSSANALGTKATLWLKKTGSRKWARIATATVSRVRGFTDLIVQVKFHTTKAAPGSLRITIAKSAKAQASTSKAVHVIKRNGLIGIPFV